MSRSENWTWESWDCWDWFQVDPKENETPLEMAKKLISWRGRLLRNAQKEPKQMMEWVGCNEGCKCWSGSRSPSKTFWQESMKATKSIRFGTFFLQKSSNISSFESATSWIRKSAGSERTILIHKIGDWWWLHTYPRCCMLCSRSQVASTEGSVTLDEVLMLREQAQFMFLWISRQKQMGKKTWKPFQENCLTYLNICLTETISVLPRKRFPYVMMREKSLSSTELPRNDRYSFLLLP